MFDFEIQDGVLTWYKGEAETVTIPREVVRIGAGAFQDSEVVRVLLHDGITRIHRDAFSGCYRLREIDIPDSVTRIDRRAFYKCTALESVHLPARLEMIQDSTFAGCVSLKRITLPETVRVIGAAAFQGCASLEAIDMPDTLEEILEVAFSGCANLKLEALPVYLKTLGALAFDRCPLITELRLSGELSKLITVSLPEGLNTLYAPEDRIDEYLKNLNKPNSELSSPHHCMVFQRGDLWRIDRQAGIQTICRNR